MKFVVALVLSTFAFSALAQKHMVNFDLGEVYGALTWSKSKEKGESVNEDRTRVLSVNYAYTLLPYLQVGGKVNYGINSASDSSSEDYGFQVGAIYNHGADIRSSYYASLYLGMQWDNNYGSFHSHGEEVSTTVAVGKRFPLSFVNLENVVYSPEISWNQTTPTKSSDIQWEQDLSIKFLNFSVFF